MISAAPQHCAPQELRSRVGIGELRHRRARPFIYQFRHRVWYLALDLDELEDAAARILILSLNRWNVLSVRYGDHFGGAQVRPADAVRAHLAELGLADAGARITLVTYPRVLGYVFNPVSFYLCYDRDDGLRVVLAEVSNTHGGQTLYTFERSGAARGAFTSRQLKRFYVSPFLSMNGRYEFAHFEAGGRSTFTVNEFEGSDGPLNLHTSLSLEWKPLTNRSVLTMLLRRPLMTFQTIAFIHVHAFRLWRRHAPFFKYRSADR